MLPAQYARRRAEAEAAGVESKIWQVVVDMAARKQQRAAVAREKAYQQSKERAL